MSQATTLPPPPPLIGEGCAILLDFDGTLVELADHPDGVVVDPALIAVLRSLRGTFANRMGLVSGRSAAQIEHFLGDEVFEVAIVGSHGAELKMGPLLLTPQRPPSLATAERTLAAAVGDHPGVVVEVKSLGVAVHYRMAPEIEQVARPLIERIAAGTGLAVQEGKMMIELRAGGHDKGSGIAALMQHAPFAGSRPIFAGDDVTDEAGFRAVAEMGGIGVLVGPERPTMARYRLDDVRAVRAWLAAAA